MGKRGRKATRAVERLHHEGDQLLAEVFRLSAVAQGLAMPVTAAVLRQVGETGVAELRNAVAKQRAALAQRGRLVDEFTVRRGCDSIALGHADEGMGA